MSRIHVLNALGDNAWKVFDFLKDKKKTISHIVNPTGGRFKTADLSEEDLTFLILAYDVRVEYTQERDLRMDLRAGIRISEM